MTTFDSPSQLQTHFATLHNNGNNDDAVTADDESFYSVSDDDSFVYGGNLYDFRQNSIVRHRVDHSRRHPMTRRLHYRIVIALFC